MIPQKSNYNLFDCSKNTAFMENKDTVAPTEAGPETSDQIDGKQTI